MFSYFVNEDVHSASPELNMRYFLSPYTFDFGKQPKLGNTDLFPVYAEQAGDASLHHVYLRQHLPTRITNSFVEKRLRITHKQTKIKLIISLYHTQIGNNKFSIILEMAN